MIKLGTHVHWLRGDHEAGGTVAECLTGDLTMPNHVVITTIIVQTDDGGLELVPETALHTDAPMTTVSVPAGAPVAAAGASAGTPDRVGRSARPDPALRRELFRRCRPVTGVAGEGPGRGRLHPDPREGTPGRLWR